MARQSSFSVFFVRAVEIVKHKINVQAIIERGPGEIMQKGRSLSLKVYESE